MAAPGSFFAPEGLLAHAHPSYEHRPGQEAMARAVERTLRHGGVLMVEAGTGTGKTLAYLVPAHASGRRVIVSTGTRNLQDQIFNLDLPFLGNRAGMRISASLMKGRDNYLCRYRFAQFEREGLLEIAEERSWVPRIHDWGKVTASGDRAEIGDLPDHLRFWKDVNARADTCGGSRCPEFESCWLTVMRRRAEESQVVVVNHHLFFADLAMRGAYGAVLPEYDTVIFDEAHLLEEVATLYFGTQVGATQIEDLARDAERLAARAGGAAKGGGGASLLRAASAEFFLPLRERLRGSLGRARFAAREEGGPELEGLLPPLHEALAEVGRQATWSGPAEAAESIDRRSEDLRSALVLVLDRRDPSFVYGMEVRGRANVVLSASPIDVSGVLRERLFGRLHAAVLTSATLAVEGRFDFFRLRLGLDDCETLVVESPFDHASQAVLYLPQEMPEPRDAMFVPRAVAEIRGLLEITRGRAFLLFTSHAQLQRVRQELAVLERWPLLVQGEGSRAALVESFKSTPGAVLLGTASFWHGVDVPGDALSLVVVDKLPFDVPSDPLVAARIDRIRREGGDPFREYQTPLAVLELKQGLGRLLRSRADRGIVAVLDPRILTRAYGSIFLRSLPPYRRVRDLDACRAFFDGSAP